MWAVLQKKNVQFKCEQRLNADSKYKFDIKSKTFDYLNSNILFQSISATANTYSEKNIRKYNNIAQASGKSYTIGQTFRAI